VFPAAKDFALVQQDFSWVLSAYFHQQIGFGAHLDFVGTVFKKSCLRHHLDYELFEKI